MYTYIYVYYQSGLQYLYSIQSELSSKQTFDYVSCVAVCCRVLPCVAVCCRVLPCVSVRFGLLHWFVVVCCIEQRVDFQECRV